MAKYVQEPRTWLALGMPSKWKHRSTRREPKIVLKCHLLQKFQTKGKKNPHLSLFKKKNKITSAKPNWRGRRWLRRQLVPNPVGSLWLDWTVCSPLCCCMGRRAKPTWTFLRLSAPEGSWAAGKRCQPSFWAKKQRQKALKNLKSYSWPGLEVSVRRVRHFFPGSDFCSTLSVSTVHVWVPRDEHDVFKQLQPVALYQEVHRNLLKLIFTLMSQPGTNPGCLFFSNVDKL